MMKRIVIVHGWEFTPESNWYPWLKQELEKKGFVVAVPAMPDTEKPRIDAWVKALAKAVGTPDANTILVGHSIGCQAILRYLQAIQGKVSGVVLVAPWFTLTPEAVPTAAYRAIAKPWIETQIDFVKARRAAGAIVALFSDNDPYVTQENQRVVKEKLGAKIILDKGKGHFSADEGVTELQSALQAVLLL
jgi:predicted alpha/beta hydrolase family esterase